MARKRNNSPIRCQPGLQYEYDLWRAGKQIVVGVDEAGRGAWAGPVTAGAVVLSSNHPGLLDDLSGVRDSKMMTPLQRDYWVKVIRETALAYSSGWATCGEIDTLGILPATRLAMQRAIAGLVLQGDHLLIDAVHLPEVNIPQTSLIKGDAVVLSIAAASIIAKTERDGYMQLLEEEIGGYGFSRHKGYGTALHREALAHLGASSQHRKSYAPIKALTYIDQQVNAGISQPV